MHIKHAQSPLLVEYLDADKPSPQVGEQWIRITTINPAYSPWLLAPLGLMMNRSTPKMVGAVRTQTSVGTI